MPRVHIWRCPYYLHRGWKLPLYEPHIKPPDHKPAYILELLQDMAIMLDTVMTTRYRSYFSVLTLTYPLTGKYELSNVLFCKTLDAYMDKIQGSHPCYIWVREKRSSEHHHYHLGLIIDDRFTQSYITLGRELEVLWNKALGLPVGHKGLVEYIRAERTKCELLNRDLTNYTVYSNALYKFSYLAKLYSKEEDLPIGIKRWSKSRITPINP